MSEKKLDEEKLVERIEEATEAMVSALRALADWAEVAGPKFKALLENFNPEDWLLDGVEDEKD